MPSLEPQLDIPAERQEPETQPEESAEEQSASEAEPEELEESPEPYVSPVDWNAAWAVNDDIIAWLYIPGISLSYPVVMDPEDNSFYLTHDAEQNEQSTEKQEPSGNMIDGHKYTKKLEMVATAYASIDDMQDNEFMYIQYNGANGNAASLRKGGNPATFAIWIGKNNDPTVDTSFAYFQVKLLNGSGNVIMTDYTSSGIANPDANGWRNLNVDVATHKASLVISYEIVAANQKNITGLLRSSTSAFS